MVLQASRDSGSGGAPANFHPKWFLNLGLKIPAAQDCFESESLLADAAVEGMKFTVLDLHGSLQVLQRYITVLLDTTSMEEGSFPAGRKNHDWSRRCRRGNSPQPFQTTNGRGGLDAVSSRRQEKLLRN